MKDETIFPIIKNSNYGLVNVTGFPITEIKYISMGNQSDGFCIGNYHENGSLWSDVINSNGNIIHKTLDIVRNFSETLALTLSNDNNKYGFINQLGEYKIPPIFDNEDVEGIYYTNPTGFSENKTFVLLDKQIALIDHEGSILFQNQKNYTDAHRFCDNIALVEDKKGATFFITTDNTKLEIIPHDYNVSRANNENFYGFRNGYCRVFKNGKTSFINITGDLIFPDKQFSSASDFHEQLSVVKQEGKYGVINISGDFIIEPRYDFIGNFNNGIAPYSLNKIWGLIDNSGKIIFEATLQAETVFEKIENFGMRYSSDPFHNVLYSPIARAKVKKQNGKFQKTKEVYINRVGEIVFDYEIAT